MDGTCGNLIAAAFLNVLLVDEIYMRQQNGFEKDDGHAWKLKELDIWPYPRGSHMV